MPGVSLSLRLLIVAFELLEMCDVSRSKKYLPYSRVLGLIENGILQNFVVDIQIKQITIDFLT